VGWIGVLGTGTPGLLYDECWGSRFENAKVWIEGLEKEPLDLPNFLSLSELSHFRGSSFLYIEAPTLSFSFPISLDLREKLPQQEKDQTFSPGTGTHAEITLRDDTKIYLRMYFDQELRQSDLKPSERRWTGIVLGDFNPKKCIILIVEESNDYTERIGSCTLSTGILTKRDGGGWSYLSEEIMSKWRKETPLVKRRIRLR
jgi:hypothetical protein